MNYVSDPADPVLRMEIERDPLLAHLWVEFCATQGSQGFDPNKPPPFVLPFREFANHRMKPYVESAGRDQYAIWQTAAQGEL
ncbi:MAG TPA: hypothetical protein VFR81_20810, partial [Longimicrobium sp.]|nr:hypothetical protein [Longimicrobium sp.]